MVNISIDVTDLGGEARPGDKVVLWKPAAAGSSSHAGRVISTAPVDVFLTNGKASVPDVEPGDMRVLLQCRGVESQGPIDVTVPDGNGTVTLRSLIESQFEYAPPIVSAVQEAAANASASERAAIEAQVRSEAAADRADAKVDDAINNGAALVRDEVKQDADRAVAARQAATQSESNAKASESKAATSASNAKASETNAKQSETNAGDYAAVATTAATEAVDAMGSVSDIIGAKYATQEYVDASTETKADKSHKHKSADVEDYTWQLGFEDNPDTHYKLVRTTGRGQISILTGSIQYDGDVVNKQYVDLAVRNKADLDELDAAIDAVAQSEVRASTSASDANQYAEEAKEARDATLAAQVEGASQEIVDLVPNLALRETTKTDSDPRPGLNIQDNSSGNVPTLRLADTASHKSHVVNIQHAAPTGNGQTYGINVANLPGAASAFVIHQYSRANPSVQIDNTDLGASIYIKNTQNQHMNPGGSGTGPFFQLKPFSEASSTLMLQDNLTWRNSTSKDMNVLALNPSKYGFGVTTPSGSSAATLKLTNQGAGKTIDAGAFSVLANGDVEISDPTAGVILASPNGTRFRLTVGDDGTLSTEAV